MSEATEFVGEVHNHYSRDLGYVFIRPSHDPTQSLFLHQRDFRGDFSELRRGTRVRYCMGRDRQGRPCATQAELDAEALAPQGG